MKIVPKEIIVNKTACWVISGLAMSIALTAGIAFAGQDRYTLKVPDGLAFAEFKGYEKWEDVAVSETQGSVKAILANPVMMAAYKKGIPLDGKSFPEGSKIVKIEWIKKKNRGVTVFCRSSGHPQSGVIHREGLEEIPGYARMGLRAVCLRSGFRHLQTFSAFRNRTRVWTCMPHGRRGAGLHFHSVSEEVSPRGAAEKA